MKILIDMNLSPRLCSMLASEGFAALHWRDVGSPRASDREILSWAKRERYVVLTHDLDFGAILASTGFDTPSVLQIRRRDIHPEALFPVLFSVLTEYSDILESGALLVIDELRTRVRMLPLK